MTQNGNTTQSLDVRARSTANNKEVETFTHEQFLLHAGTKIHLEKLRRLRDEILLQATLQNQLTDSGKQQALIKLTQADTINKVLLYLNENNYPNQ